MSIHDRLTTRPRAHSSTALRVAASGRQPAERRLDRRPACRSTTHDQWVAGPGNVTDARGVQALGRRR